MIRSGTEQENAQENSAFEKMKAKLKIQSAFADNNLDCEPKIANHRLLATATKLGWLGLGVSFAFGGDGK